MVQASECGSVRWLCHRMHVPQAIAMLGGSGGMPPTKFVLSRHKMVHSGGLWGKINLFFYLKFCHFFAM